MTETPHGDEPSAVPDPAEAQAVTPVSRTGKRRRKSKKVRRARSEVPIRLGDLLSGLPALVVAALAVSALALTLGNRTLAESYNREATARFNHGDFAGSVVCFQRLSSLTPDRPEVRYFMAIALEKVGEPTRAEAVMRALAPESRAGFPLAEYWLGSRLFRNRNRGPAEMASAEVHLARAIDGLPAASPRETVNGKVIRDSKAMLGTIFAETGRMREARPFLQASSSTDRPDLLLVLSYVCRQLDDKESADRAAGEALKALQTYCQQRPNDREGRLLLAQAYARLDQYQEGVDVLEGASKLLGEAAWRKSVSSLHVAWAEALGKAGPSRNADRFAVVEKGLRYDPKNAWLLQHLSQVLMGDPAAAEKARQVLRTMLGSGEGLAVAHFALGSAAWKNGRHGEARMHWEQACRLDATVPELANNLAWLLAHEEPVDLPRALAVAEAAIKLNPTSPVLKGTHGQILVKLKRWNEAIPELETALKDGQKTPGIHASLAEAYAGLGIDDMAAEHRKAAH